MGQVKNNKKKIYIKKIQMKRRKRSTDFMRISQYSGSKAENNESTSFIAIRALCTTIQFADYKKRKSKLSFVDLSKKIKNEKDKEKEKPCISHLESLEASLPEPF